MVPFTAWYGMAINRTLFDVTVYGYIFEGEQKPTVFVSVPLNANELLFPV